jgi:hypothetical protein
MDGGDQARYPGLHHHNFSIFFLKNKWHKEIPLLAWAQYFFFSNLPIVVVSLRRRVAQMAPAPKTIAASPNIIESVSLMETKQNCS